MTYPTSTEGHRRSISVVIPAKNEARNLPAVLSALPDGLDEVILVDGGSVDDTVEVAQRCYPGIRIVNQTRRGKGNALAAGFAAATGDYIVMIDADGSMDPAEITRFVAALETGADYVKGSRFVPGGGSTDLTWLRRWGNWMLNQATNLLIGTRFTDLCYGYNAFRRECVAAMALPPAHTNEPQWGDGFEIETLINIRVASAGLQVREVPSFESPRLFGTSNLRTFRDGFRVLQTIFSERWRSWTKRQRGIAVTRPPASGSSCPRPDHSAVTPWAVSTGSWRAADQSLRALESDSPTPQADWAAREGGAA